LSPQAIPVRQPLVPWAARATAGAC
jgi:hypothetical protein